jgi:hypothetical protein
MITSLLKETINVQENIKIENSLDVTDLVITNVNIGTENTKGQNITNKIVQEIIKEIVLVSMIEIGKDLEIGNKGEVEIDTANNTLDIKDTQPHHLPILHIWEITVADLLS